MASSGAASYADCVSSLRNSLKFLDSSVSTLDDGVADFPRLVKRSEEHTSELQSYS